LNLDRGEPQAIFQGFVSPRQIEQVYLKSQELKSPNVPDDFNYHIKQDISSSEGFQKMSPEEFIKYYESGEWSIDKRQRYEQEAIIEPQEQVDYSVFLSRVSKEFEKPIEWIEEYLVDMFGDYSSEDIFRNLMSGGVIGQYPYSVAKKLSLEIFDTIQQKKNQNDPIH